MFDFQGISKSADAMAQAATDIVARLDEQNALLGALVLDTIEEGSGVVSQDVRDIAAHAIQRCLLRRQEPSNG